MPRAFALHSAQVEACGDPPHDPGREERPVIMYVDAYVFRRGQQPGRGPHFAAVEEVIRRPWGPGHQRPGQVPRVRLHQKNQIWPAELITPLCVAHAAPHLLKGRRVIIFGDNLGGVCCTIKGSSREWNLQYVHHRDHPSNPADELSRGDTSPYASPTLQLEFPDSLLPTGRFGDPF